MPHRVIVRGASFALDLSDRTDRFRRCVLCQHHLTIAVDLVMGDVRLIATDAELSHDFVCIHLTALRNQRQARSECFLKVMSGE